MYLVILRLFIYFYNLFIYELLHILLPLHRSQSLTVEWLHRAGLVHIPGLLHVMPAVSGIPAVGSVGNNWEWEYQG